MVVVRLSPGSVISNLPVLSAPQIGVRPLAEAQQRAGRTCHSPRLEIGIQNWFKKQALFLLESVNERSIKYAKKFYSTSNLFYNHCEEIPQTK